MDNCLFYLLIMTTVHSHNISSAFGMARFLVLVAGRCYPLSSLARSKKLGFLLKIKRIDVKVHLFVVNVFC